MKFLHRLAATIIALFLVVYALGALARFDYLVAIRQAGGIGLFLVTTISSSIFFVFSSEVVIVASTKFVPPLEVIFFATLGSTLGAAINYAVGAIGLTRFLEDDNKEKKSAEKWFEQWGDGAVFFASVIPFVGDVITVVAGTLKMDFTRFLAYSLAGRVLKTIILVVLGQAALSVLRL